MICGWENCTEKSENLADHIYYTHLEHIPKDFGKFKCKWRFCDHETIYKYKSHLSLHLRQHLKEYSEADTKENAQSSQIDKTRSKVDDKTTQSGSVERYDEYKEGEKITCPAASCNVVLSSSYVTRHMRNIHNLQYYVRIKCTKCDKLYSPSGVHRCTGINLIENENQTYHENNSETTASEGSSSSDDSLSEDEETFHTGISKNDERIRIVCKEDDRVICPIELCGSNLAPSSVSSHLRRVHGKQCSVSIECIICKELYSKRSDHKKRCHGKKAKRKKASNSKQIFNDPNTDGMNTSSSSSAKSEKSRHPSRTDEQQVLHIKCKEGERIQCPVQNCKTELAASSIQKHLSLIHGKRCIVRTTCNNCGKDYPPKYKCKHVKKCEGQSKDDSPLKKRPRLAEIQQPATERSHTTVRDIIVMDEGGTQCPLCSEELSCSFYKHVKTRHPGKTSRVRCKQCSVPVHPDSLQRHKLSACPNKLK